MQFSMKIGLINETRSPLRPFSKSTIGGLIIGTSLYYPLPSDVCHISNHCGHVTLMCVVMSMLERTLNPYPANTEID